MYKRKIAVKIRFDPCPDSSFNINTTNGPKIAKFRFSLRNNLHKIVFGKQIIPNQNLKKVNYLCIEPISYIVPYLLKKFDGLNMF